ncbi:MAG: 30S ribosomal protein S12 methylthiotransferase RimO [Verrucomicrobia bacterium]|nr:30S ribosomal protein S12 methylthiotransferase RimO [Verrucomicrobiota bacterium]MDE3098720.1 30S ribosomal protein S12 methylthiotransferase RimO [Verrucomicrobiota bacterium]
MGLISLGCAKNLVDAEIMLGALLEKGLVITNKPSEADALIVNTCSFIGPAQEESVDAILESVALRDAQRRGQAVIVAGCLPQRFRDQLPALLPEVDAFMGVDQVARAPEIISDALARRARKMKEKAPGRQKPHRHDIVGRLGELDKEEAGAGKARGEQNDSPPAKEPLLEVTQRPVFIPDFATPRFRLTPKHFAYLKIAEGCNHPCSFCIIPRMRGSHRSRAQDDLVAEATALLGGGVKEIVLISQDSTYYGLDLRPGHSRAVSSPEKFSRAARALPAGATTICTLLRQLDALEGDFWIRLLYTHPAHWTDELIATLAACKKVARYVDMPLQHVHDNMLERMRRETSRQYIVDLIAKIRAAIPGIALRTTFIVGFPGETEACFESLLDFIRETKFERLGVFAYSREEGTRAGAMSGRIPEAIRRERRQRAMAEQRKVARQVSKSHVGRALKVLVEGRLDEKQWAANAASWEHGFLRAGKAARAPGGAGPVWVARGEADAPDIDGRVYVRSKRPLAIGEFAAVKVIGHGDYDLLAEEMIFSHESDTH